MKAFHDLNRLLCLGLEIINILLALPLGALIYAISVEYMTQSLTTSAIQYNEMVVTLVAIGVAIIGVFLINGGIAQALDKRRFLEAISTSIDDLDHEGRHPAPITVATIETPAKTPGENSGEALGKTAPKKAAAKTPINKSIATKQGAKSAPKK